MRRYNRVNICVDKGIQTRFVLYTLISLIIGCVIVSAYAFYSVWIDIGDKILHSHSINTMFTSSLNKFIATNLFIITILAIITSFGMLLLSHKIAGPAFRIKKMLKELQEGKDPTFELRKGDALKPIMEELEKLAVQHKSIGESALRVVETWRKTQVKDMSLNLALKELENKIIYLSIEQNNRGGKK
ncbi:hypothetical protein M0P98_02865 [bacterium]|nr:hypothetical protein [bacterium]